MATGGEINAFQAMGPGLPAISGSEQLPAGQNQGQGQPLPSQQRGKKQQPPQRLVASKISMMSSKAAEIMSWEAKVKESTTLYPGHEF